MSHNLRSPHTVDDVLDQLAEGRLTPAEAFSLFRQIDRGVKPVEQVKPRTKDKEAAETEADREKRLAEVIEELDQLIGLSSVKELVKEVRAFVEIQRRRSEAQLNTEPTVLHMIFKGNPGTGKTTVARIFGRMFKEMGVLPKGHLIECERADLVGEYIGHTAQKTRDQVKKALGGILFIDEAYSLARGGEKDFGKEAIDCLVKSMEDQKDQFVLILAGYREEMDGFLQLNPGLQSRFPIHIDFPDYSGTDLMRIADMMLGQRQYTLTPTASLKLERLIQNQVNDWNPHFGNARTVRNTIERAIRRQAVRLVKKKHVTRQDLMQIEAADIEGDVAE